MLVSDHNDHSDHTDHIVTGGNGNVDDLPMFDVMSQVLI